VEGSLAQVRWTLSLKNAEHVARLQRRADAAADRLRAVGLLDTQLDSQGGARGAQPAGE
jgi:hypothetical protein